MVSTHLPSNRASYSILRSSILALPFSIFRYLRKPLLPTSLLGPFLICSARAWTMACRSAASYSMPPAPGYPLTGYTPAEPVSDSPNNRYRHNWVREVAFFENGYPGTMAALVSCLRWGLATVGEYNSESRSTSIRGRLLWQDFPAIVWRSNARGYTHFPTTDKNHFLEACRKPPVRRISGRTVWVIQRLNALALGLRDLNINSYKPGSLMICNFLISLATLVLVIFIFSW